MMIEMTVDGVMYDVMKRPVVILRNGDKILPILVGNAEAFAIANALEKVGMPRPMTHDLITFILKGFQADMKWAHIYKLEGGTFYAYLVLNQKAEETGDSSVIKIDCRPSDAMAIALRMNSPIYVEEEVLQLAGQEGQPQTLEQGEFESELEEGEGEEGEEEE